MFGNEIGNASYIIQMEDGHRIGLLFRPIRGNRDKARHASERQLRGCAFPANFDFRKVFPLEPFNENQIARAGLRQDVFKGKFRAASKLMH